MTAPTKDALGRPGYWEGGVPSARKERPSQGPEIAKGQPTESAPR